MGSGGLSLPPMNHSGISTPQSIGATAVPGSLDQKLTQGAGNPAAPNASSTLLASSSSDGRSSPTAGVTPSSLPATRLATITPKALERCFFLQAEDGIRYLTVTGVQTCALPI